MKLMADSRLWWTIFISKRRRDGHAERPSQCMLVGLWFFQTVKVGSSTSTYLGILVGQFLEIIFSNWPDNVHGRNGSECWPSDAAATGTTAMEVTGVLLPLFVPLRIMACVSEFTFWNDNSFSRTRCCRCCRAVWTITIYCEARLSMHWHRFVLLYRLFCFPPLLTLRYSGLGR